MRKPPIFEAQNHQRMVVIKRRTMRSNMNRANHRSRCKLIVVNLRRTSKNHLKRRKKNQRRTRTMTRKLKVDMDSAVYRLARRS
ncbi:unnamed protein product [Anisakis simplex]|uniref:Uncharacterized protein n=1 Tax=Anisakis simplex TaxID=6269 RepID=A0A3P6TEG0_ANISI|nr:unnamed protein product [Anisakis simplex]